MNIKQFIEESCNESLIEKIYYNELYFQEYIPDSKEYEKANKKMLKASDFIMNNIDEKIKTKFIEYMENATIKEGIEAEMNFKLGFKTAVKLIIEGLE